jgi:hypothetical protein
MLKNNKRAKGFLAVLLAVALLIAVGVQPVFAASVSDQMKEQAGGSDESAEYYAFTKMWSEYFLDFLPTDAEPEALKLLVNMPEENATLEVWRDYFSSVKDENVSIWRDEIFRIARKLDLMNPSLSQTEKAKRIAANALTADWFSGPFRGTDLLDSACGSRAQGLCALYRLSEIPALGVRSSLNSSGHIEAYCYLDGEWRVAAEWSSFDLDGNGLTRGLIDYNKDLWQTSMIDGALGGFTWAGTAYYAPSILEDDPVSFQVEPRQSVMEIIDIDESWIDRARTEYFMFKLLQKPFAYPEQKLTRGEVAKLLCNYIGAAPMRNEQVFADVPTDHKYARYIWAMNRLGIMNGNGDGTFRPDSELSMQEFAVVANSVIQWGKAEAVKQANSWRDTNPYMDEYSPEEIARIDAGYKKKAEEGFTPSVNSTPRVFADSAEIASWAKPAVDELSRWGILQGDSADANSRLRPTELLSKTRFLVFMAKFDEKLHLFDVFLMPKPVF